MKEQEHNLQVACVKWFRLQYPKHIIFAIPNGGQRNTIVAAKMKAEGVTAGVPDLFVPHAVEPYHGLFIELKNGRKGRLSNAQKSMIFALGNEGYKCCIVRDIEGFMSSVNAYFNGEPF